MSEKNSMDFNNATGYGIISPYPETKLPDNDYSSYYFLIEIGLYTLSEKSVKK